MADPLHDVQKQYGVDFNLPPTSCKASDVTVGDINENFIRRFTHMPNIISDTFYAGMSLCLSVCLSIRLFLVILCFVSVTFYMPFLVLI